MKYWRTMAFYGTFDSMKFGHGCCCCSSGQNIYTHRNSLLPACISLADITIVKCHKCIAPERLVQFLGNTQHGLPGPSMCIVETWILLIRSNKYASVCQCDMIDRYTSATVKMYVEMGMLENEWLQVWLKGMMVIGCIGWDGWRVRDVQHGFFR